MVQAQSSAVGVKVYASRFSGGELGLVFVNQRESPCSLEISLAGFTPKGKIQGWVLTGKNLNVKQVSWNGVDGPAGGGGPFPIRGIAPYQLKFDPSKPLTLNIAPNSVSGVVVY